MSKTIKNTLILTVTLCLFIIGGFAIYSYTTLDSEELYKDPIDKNSDLVINLMSRVRQNDELRIPYLNTQNIDNERLIKYIFGGLNSNDMQITTVQPQKIICEIDGVQFTKDTTCYITIIDNEVFENYKRLYFNSTQQLDYIDFKYNGKTCKNKNNKYYCLDEQETESYKGKSVIDSAYIYDNKIVITEYYLLTKVYQNMEYQEPTNDQVKEEGVLYKHTFIRNPNIAENEKEELNYYLEESTILND